MLNVFRLMYKRSSSGGIGEPHESYVSQKKPALQRSNEGFKNAYWCLSYAVLC